MAAITPSLWFDDDLEAALEFYRGIFDDMTVHHVGTAGDAVTTASFEINGQRFLAMNAGPMFPFTEAVSFTIDCVDQAEADRYYDALLDGGEQSQCGWLKDRFGLSWQIVPARLPELLADPDPARARAAMGAMMSMTRIVVADLEAAVAAV
ncbi:MAG: VOC family protein [Corynebacteriales bacterium]|nr:VOC family protein [Mycobacteriales bacterium]